MPTSWSPRLKDRVYLWNTFNEPDTYASLTYLLGGFPPFHKWRFGSYRKVIKHMAAGARASEPHHPRDGNAGRKAGSRHREELDVFRRVSKIFACGIMLLAATCHHAFNRFVLDAFLGGGGARRRPFSVSIIMAARASTISRRWFPPAAFRR